MYQKKFVNIFLWIFSLFYLRNVVFLHVYVYDTRNMVMFITPDLQYQDIAWQILKRQIFFVYLEQITKINYLLWQKCFR